jgi:hypothetical protein
MSNSYKVQKKETLHARQLVNINQGDHREPKYLQEHSNTSEYATKTP